MDSLRSIRGREVLDAVMELPHRLPAPLELGKAHMQPAPQLHHQHPTGVPAPGTLRGLTLHSQQSPRAAARLFLPGQAEFFKATPVTAPLQPGWGANLLPHSPPAPLHPLPTGRGMCVPPVHGAGRRKRVIQLFQTTFSGRDGPGSQARPWPLSSPSLPPALLPSAPPLLLNDFHMGLWRPEPSLPALSEISKFRRNMKIVKRPFLRG